MSAQTHMPRLSDEIKQAIVKNDIMAMYRLKDICDRIHSTGEPYQGYTQEDLPSDALYEEMVRKITELSSTTRIITERKIAYGDVVHRHHNYISDLWMDSITKLDIIPDIPDAILLPKFDGCSCGVKMHRVGQSFVLDKAVTRGREVNEEKRNTDLTEKFAMISQQLLDALSTITHSNDYTFSNGKLFSNASALTIRGEIVLKNKMSGPVPASWIAGKINGGMDVWVEALELIEFVPYEIMRIYDHDEPYVPTQFETIDLLETIKLFKYPYKLVNLKDTSLKEVLTYFDTLNKSITEPIDGVVYCAQDWTYPMTVERTKPAQYGKFAWKPTSEATSILREISYTLSREGVFTFILTYDPVIIHNKKYKNAKMVTSQMLKLPGIGIGSIVTVHLAGDISPQIIDMTNPIDETIVPFEFPKLCPFCNAPTKLRQTKQCSKLICPNEYCRAVTTQKMLNLLDRLSVQGIGEKSLNALPELTFEAVCTKYIHDIRSILDVTDTITFLMGLGLGGKTQVKKVLPKEILAILPITQNFDNLFTWFAQYRQDDPFIDSVISYMNVIIKQSDRLVSKPKRKVAK